MASKHKELSYIIIGFENCQILKIPAKYIDTIHIDKITTTTYINCNTRFSHLVCKNLFVRFHSSIKNLWYVSKYWPISENVLNRFERHKDVVSIDLCYKDGTIEMIYAPWSEEDEWNNLFEKFYLDEYKDYILEVTSE